MRARLLLLLVAVLMVLAAAMPAGAAEPQSDHAPRTPIKHFVTLMQENHTFDNYFGTYPGADGIPKGVCQRFELDKPKCQKPFYIGNQAVSDMGHSVQVFERQYNGGKMDGFVAAFADEGGEAKTTMGHYDDRDIPYYWNVADDYVLFDRFFTSANGGSLRNHMYWVAGQPGNEVSDAIPTTGFDFETIFDRLNAAGVSWKFYVQNYDPSITLFNKEIGDRGSQIVWVPILNFPRYLIDQKFMSHIVPLTDYYEDLERGTLPEVSYIVPSGASEHPPGSIQAGEAFVRTLVGSLMRSSSWDSSAFMWTYDDWGGWYDHVAPPQVDQFGYGFRTPALLVSPYAKKGHVDSTTLDFASILKFIEHNWNLAPLATRDANANTFLEAFDFEQPPRPAVLLHRERVPEPLVAPKQLVVYTSYGFAAILPGALIVYALVSQRRRRRWRRA